MDFIAWLVGLVLSVAVLLAVFRLFRISTDISAIRTLLELQSLPEESRALARRQIELRENENRPGKSDNSLLIAGLICGFFILVGIAVSAMK